MHSEKSSSRSGCRIFCFRILRAAHRMRYFSARRCIFHAGHTNTLQYPALCGSANAPKIKTNSGVAAYFSCYNIGRRTENTIRRTEQMANIGRWAIENRTDGMLAAQKAPARSLPIVSFSPARTAAYPQRPQKSAPDALCQTMRNVPMPVKRTAGRCRRLQEGC